MKRFATAGATLLPVVTLWLNIPDIVPRMLGSVVTIAGEFYVLSYVSRLSVPEAFAVNSFKSFVEPVGRLLATRGTIEYVASGKEVSLAVGPNEKDAHLEVVMPDDLSIGGLNKCETETYRNSVDGYLHSTEGEANTRRRYKIRFNPREVADGEPLAIYDVPNNLRSLEVIVREDVHGKESRRSAAEVALNEYYDELEDRLDIAELKHVTLRRSKARPG